MQQAAGWAIRFVGSVRHPQAYLQHRTVHLRPGECQKAHGRHQLKFVHRLKPLGFQLFFRFHHRFIAGNQCFFGDIFPVQPNPFPELHQIGRGKQPHPVAAFPERRRRHGRYAALAVGARDMHHLQLLLGISQRVHESANPV